jgi:hypothetical protein
MTINTDTSLSPSESNTDVVPEPEPEDFEFAQVSGHAPEVELDASITDCDEQEDAPGHSDDGDGEYGGVGDEEQDGEHASADEYWTDGSVDDEVTEHSDVNATNRLEPLAALFAQAPESWMRGACQADLRFLVRYPALSGLGSEDAAIYGGHEWVGRDQIYPLRVAADTSGGG